jgi:hypothetical protein
MTGSANVSNLYKAWVLSVLLHSETDSRLAQPRLFLPGMNRVKQEESGPGERTIAGAIIAAAFRARRRFPGTASGRE